jgi:SPP1 gp7 family putative phage head morphogenesis protein
MDNYTLAAFDAANIVKRSLNSTLNYVRDEIAKILRHTGGEDTLAYEYRMKRLTALLAKTDAKMKELYGVTLGDTTALLKEVIPEAYYHTIFDIAQGAGVQPQFSAVNSKLIDKIINENWSGENYSKRIWKNTNKLAESVREVLTEAAMNGESIYKTSRKLSEAFNTTAYNAQRLIRTETTYAANQAEMLSYKELDIERYEFVATLDTRTSPICQKQDGKIYEVKEAKAGVNLPAMHPNCRSTTIPYFEDGMPKLRAARDENGKRITVPASMKYDEWYKKYIEPYENKQKKPKKPPKAQPGTSVPVEIPAPQGADSGYTDVKIPKRGK